MNLRKFAFGLFVAAMMFGFDNNQANAWTPFKNLFRGASSSSTCTTSHHTCYTATHCCYTYCCPTYHCHYDPCCYYHCDPCCHNYCYDHCKTVAAGAVIQVKVPCGFHGPIYVDGKPCHGCGEYRYVTTQPIPFGKYAKLLISLYPTPMGGKDAVEVTVKPYEVAYICLY